METTSSRLLTTEELAARLGVHPETILRWGRRGCPRRQIRLRTYGYDPQAVETWLQDQAAAGRQVAS